MLENEILHLEKKITRLQKQLDRSKDNAIHVTISPVENKIGKEIVYRVNSFLNMYFEEIVYSYDAEENTIVLLAEAHRIWPPIQLALESNRIDNKVLRDSLELLVHKIRNSSSKNKTYYLS